MPAMPGEPLSSHSFVELLVSVPALTDLTLEGEVVRHDTNNFPPITLARLESLSITEDMYDICLAMSCPALTSLELGEMPDGKTDDLVWMFRQSQSQPKYPALTHLKFKSGHFIDLNNAFINALPTITHIGLSSCVGAIDMLGFIIAFEPESDDNVAWPNLQKLIMNPFEPYYVHPLCDLAAARIRIGLPLQGIMLRETDVARFTQTPFLRDNLPVELIRM
jgi:hypothetical protein